MSAKSDVLQPDKVRKVPEILGFGVYQNPSNYGLCQNIDDPQKIEFRLPNDKWKLVLSNESLLNRAETQYPGVDRSKIFLRYWVDSKDDFQVGAELVSIATKEEIVTRSWTSKRRTIRPWTMH